MHSHEIANWISIEIKKWELKFGQFFNEKVNFDFIFRLFQFLTIIAFQPDSTLQIEIELSTKLTISVYWCYPIGNKCKTCFYKRNGRELCTIYFEQFLLFCTMMYTLQSLELATVRHQTRKANSCSSTDVIVHFYVLFCSRQEVEWFSYVVLLNLNKMYIVNENSMMIG